MFWWMELTHFHGSISSVKDHVLHQFLWYSLAGGGEHHDLQQNPEYLRALLYYDVIIQTLQPFLIFPPVRTDAEKTK